MALALKSDLVTVIGEVARGHGYDCLKEKQLFAIEKFVSGQDAFSFVSLPTRFGKFICYLRTSTYNIRSSEGMPRKGHTAPTSFATAFVTDDVLQY